MRSAAWRSIALVTAVAGCAPNSATSPSRVLEPNPPSPWRYRSPVGIEAAMDGHVAQRDVELGLWSSSSLREAGLRLFVAKYTVHDGLGRPGATGDPSPTRRPLGSGMAFVRTAGPDANSCAACHNEPLIGGAGDLVANVFAGLGARHPVFRSIDPEFSAERGTPELNGSGLIELLAREMTRDLHKIRKDAVIAAARLGRTMRVPLVAKGVSFGFVSAERDGTLRLNEVEGIDRDLVVRPWGQKGVVTSLRTFTVSAMNLHHGMEARERFGLHLTGTADFDRDGVRDELLEGDITALVVFQATLGAPGRLMPRTDAGRKRVDHGEALFRKSACASCHVPEMVLELAIFTEPGPYNLEGTLRNQDVEAPLSIDLTREAESPRLTPRKNGSVLIRAFTDFKRHRISDAEKPHFGNEVLVEGLVPTDEFVTRRLWAVGNTSPYGHRGDLLTLREAIENHGGEARDARLEFEALPHADQAAIIAFLQSLQVLPPGSPPVLVEPAAATLPYAKRNAHETRTR
jgi:hypothetical protein